MSARWAHRLASRLARLAPLARSRWDALGDGSGDGSSVGGVSADRLELLADRLDAGDGKDAWLTLAVATGALPREEDVVDFARRVLVDGAPTVLEDLASSTGGRFRELWQGRPVEIIRGAVLVDVDHTARAPYSTGIQRVVRHLVREWSTRDTTLVAWTRDRSALRRLSTDEVTFLAGESMAVPDLPPWRGDTAVVPIGGVFVLPELDIETRSIRRIAAMARFSSTRTSVVGYDLVPIGSGETSDGGMPAAFALNLAAVRWMDSVAAISYSAAAEYEGWRTSLRAIGVPGPVVTAVPLGSDVPAASEADAADARLLLGVEDLPMLLCVGSHEPRKNHDAVLAAAESLWRSGERFSLAFVGGNAWKSEGFQNSVAELRAAGRPITTVRALPDSLLWGAYLASQGVLFPSLHEGFGLPVVEALACGVPVLTSNFGAMAEAAAGGGAVLVDPRSDSAIAEGMRSLLDPAIHARLAREAATRAPRSWSSYARDAWHVLVGDSHAN
jgi:glycosyltransferase involved in cell wall biosynthesis